MFGQLATINYCLAVLYCGPPGSDLRIIRASIHDLITVMMHVYHKQHYSKYLVSIQNYE